MNNYKLLANWIRESKNIVVLTGAGMSTASGIPDFRSTAGLWKHSLGREKYISRAFLTVNQKNFGKCTRKYFKSSC